MFCSLTSAPLLMEESNFCANFLFDFHSQFTNGNANSPENDSIGKGCHWIEVTMRRRKLEKTTRCSKEEICLSLHDVIFPEGKLQQPRSHSTVNWSVDDIIKDVNINNMENFL